MLIVMILGMNDSVIFCICVIDCSSEIVKLIMRVVISMGVVSLVVMRSFWVLMLRMVFGFI